MMKKIGKWSCLVIVLFLCGCIVFLRGNDRQEKVETYRGICWGMNMEEIEKLEVSLGNKVIHEVSIGNKVVPTISENNSVTYSISDLRISKDKSDICVYKFDGESKTLSSFIIGSITNGDEIFFTISKDLVEMYGEGKYASATDNDVIYLTADWNNENETIEGILFRSPICNEAYFTFTHNKYETE